MGVGDIARLSLWQVERALASLSEGEKIALMKIARLYARKTPYERVSSRLALGRLY